VTSAEEENDPRIVAITELAADGKTESVSVETSTPISVGWSQQDPATEYVHTSDHAARPIAPIGSRVALAARWLGEAEARPARHP
jgi:hypothetical protein